ncbi:50S ribosomal protein L15 [Candidatus Saccharibacteria bacterium]|nr:50S ribosomal protein L15 [Candidatus Saccharibacteria bacterium]
MKINQLDDPRTAKARKRKGRGIAAGSGKTAGRGTKGQKSRSGGGVRPHFEGGQTPLVRRLPKLPGFRSHRLKALTVYTGQLDDVKTNSKVIDNYVLKQVGLIEDEYANVKLIKRGEVKSGHRLQLQAASKAAVAALEAAGGGFERSARPKRPASDKKRARREGKQPAVAKKKMPAQANVVK